MVRQAFARGRDPADVARKLVEQLRAPDLRIAFVFADCRLPAATLAGIQHALPGPVVGCSTVGVVGAGGVQGDEPAAVGLGLYGDWLRVGVGVAAELSKAALTRSRDAVRHAAAALGTTVDALDPGRHIAVTLLDGRCNHEEAFCIGSAAAAPKIRFVGGSASADFDHDHKTHVWAHGEVLSDAGLVVLFDSARPFYPVTSAHMVPTELRTVVTSASGRVIHELDGRPAAARLRELVASIGDRLVEPRPVHTFARYLDGVPYVRSLHRILDPSLLLASAVEAGHVLRVMRPGDLIQTTQRDLGVAAERVGGTMAAFLAFSCIGRHLETASGGHALAEAYAAHPTVGFQTLSEQSGILLVNHTLTGLAIGAPKP